MISLPILHLDTVSYSPNQLPAMKWAYLKNLIALPIWNILWYLYNTCIVSKLFNYRYMTLYDTMWHYDWSQAQQIKIPILTISLTFKTIYWINYNTHSHTNLLAVGQIFDLLLPFIYNEATIRTWDNKAMERNNLSFPSSLAIHQLSGVVIMEHCEFIWQDRIQFRCQGLLSASASYNTDCLYPS